jgi:hypothetical protein
MLDPVKVGLVGYMRMANNQRKRSNPSTSRILNTLNTLFVIHIN